MLALLGNVELDLRQATLELPVTHLFVRAVLGNVEITVPPTMAVVPDGSGVLGNFSGVHRAPAGDTTGSVLFIIGAAVLGNVEVRTLPPTRNDTRRKLAAPRQR